MKRYCIIFYVIVVIFASSCISSQLLLQKSINISPGMTKSEVVEIMGNPTNRQFKTTENGTVYEAIQWDCGWHSGLTSDLSNKDMLIVYFKNGKVTDLNNYVAYYGEVKTVRWEERPDFVIESRSR
jgi:outer membrane protein assembly factor BamE (lipoprotein component of BamABCDE complex)